MHPAGISVLFAPWAEGAGRREALTTAATIEGILEEALQRGYVQRAVTHPTEIRLEHPDGAVLRLFPDCPDGQARAYHYPPDRQGPVTGGDPTGDPPSDELAEPAEQGEPDGDE